MRTRSGLKVFTLLALMMPIAPPVAQAQDLLWVKQWDGGGGLVAVDRNHNVYRAGNFGGTLDFDPGPGTFELTASGDMPDVFVSKLDREGGFLWVKQLTGTGYIFPNSAALDDEGNVYIFGFFYPGTYDFDPGPGTFEMTTIGAVTYVCKLDSSGNFVWAMAFEPSGADCSGALSGIVAGDHVYSVGLLEGTVDFDPGPGTFNMTSDEGPGFVSKLDSAGHFVWAVQPGAVPRGVFVEPDGSIYTVGYFFGTDDFDPGPGTFFLTSFGAEDGFISKLDSAGHFVWAGQFGGPNLVRTWGVVVDSNGNVYTVGRFSGTVDFDPGPGTFFLTSFGGNDAFVSKLDSAGHFVWAKQLGGASGDSAGLAAVDSSDNLYIVGGFRDTVDFDPGPGTFFLTAIDESDLFVWKFGYVDIRLENQDPALIHFSPDSPSLSFDVATGLLSDLQADDDFTGATCLGTFSGNPASDDSTPPAGDAYYYLARGLSCCTTQGYGDSTLVPDPRDDLNIVSPCP